VKPQIALRLLKHFRKLAPRSPRASRPVVTCCPMKAPLARFGVAMQASLLKELDRLVESRKATRSKVLGDLVRNEVMHAKLAPESPAVVTLTLVYDHHVRELTEKLTEIQHELGERVRSTLHVHLTHSWCLEVIVMQGPARALQTAAEQIIATRGVKHGAINLVTDIAERSRPRARHRHA
jgi:CopG family transcriptional regulator, nickel-responsive regulator